MTVDPVTQAVVRNGLAAVAEEMNATLVRSAYSPNIKERRDCSCAVFDPGGEMLSQAENIPVHLGAMPFSVAAAIEAYPVDELAPGDGIMVNDPFRGGAHLPDLTLITPVCLEGDLLGFVANRAHHADVGGARAGSVAAEASEIYEEGLRIPPVRLVREGTFDDELMDLVLANCRAPDERRGDLRAQLAANHTGVERLHELVARHRRETVVAAREAIKEYAERRMRAELGEIPDGSYRFEDVIESDGHGNQDLPVAVELRVANESLTVDFAGSAPQTEGAINAVEAVTASATYYAIRTVTDPDIPANAGCYRPITIEAPSGTIVNAEPPAAVVGGNLETSQRIVDVVLGAMAQHDPARVAGACQGTMNNLTFGGIDPTDDGEYTFYETQPGGFGGRPDKDGIDGVQIHMTNTLNTPAEVLETAYPLRVRRYALRPDSGGAGEFRGGLGVRRDIEVLGHRATCSVLAERRRIRPYGLAGGEDGAPGADYLLDGDERIRIDPKSTHAVGDGTVVSIHTPGGGGFGDPLARDPAAIERDLAAGKVTPETARDSYDYEAE